MSFLYPDILWFLLIIPLLLVLVVKAWRSAGQGWRRLISAQHQELVTPRPLWSTALPATLALLALCCTIIALARPINGYREGGATSTGRNLLIALDISRSMETEDVKPSRLAEAKAAAYELIEALPGDNIGLIVFSGEADLVVPLTSDHTALRDALEQVNRGWAGAGGTNFGLVLRKAMQDFKRSTPAGSTNALVILSDGEDTVNSSLEIAEEARENKLLVITVGIGTPAGGPIRDPSGENGLYQDSNGKHVISKLNTESLSQFAKATGGDFFVMNSNADLTAFTQAAVRKIDKHEEAFSLNKVPNDLFIPFASTALVLLIFTIISSTEWKQYKRVVIVLTIGGMTPHLQAAPEPHSAAAYKLGLEHIARQEDDKAKEAFSTALLDEDTSLQAAALYQLGQVNTKATLRELRSLYGDAENTDSSALSAELQASPEELQKVVDSLKQDIQPYRDALKLRPRLTRAQTNITAIEQLIRNLEEEIERLKQQNKDNEQQDSDQNQQNQDNQQQNSGKDKQNKDDQQQGSGKDKQNKDDQQQDSGKDKQDKDDQQQGSGKDKQDKDDQQQDSGRDKQDKDDQQQEPEDNKDDCEGEEPGQQQDKQTPEEQQSDQQNKKEQTEQQQAAADPAQEGPPPSDKEKAQRYAVSVLRSHLDEEQGSPIPHNGDQIRKPAKDY